MNVVEEIEKWAGAAGLELPCGSAEGLAAFHAALVETGRERGVTALREPGDVLRELILDSLGAAACLPVGARVADLGSGGGVPGLPLALVRPDCRILLVESLGRKVAWLEEQVQALGLADRVEVVSRRCEDVGRDPAYRAVLDAVVAKALAGLPVLVEYALPLLRIGGVCMPTRGRPWPRRSSRPGTLWANWVAIWQSRVPIGSWTASGWSAWWRRFVRRLIAIPDEPGCPNASPCSAVSWGQAPIDGLRWIRRGLREQVHGGGATCMGVGRHA